MTYSIVARDPMTGALGGAVQSHYFGVGRFALWAESGVGVVATQSIVEVSYGPYGLDRMRSGMSAEVSLENLITEDALAALRQVAMVDRSGEVAVHTGEGCVGLAGHRLGPQVSAQANMMERDTVWDSMIDAYLRADGEDLATRLLLALEAAESEGGDVRGSQSAALLIVDAKQQARQWDHRLIDLRVDDSDRPLFELRRLIAVNHGVDRMVAVLNSDLLYAPALDPRSAALAQAMQDLAVAQQALGDNREPSLWSAVLLAKAGLVDEARDHLRWAVETNDRWPTFLRSLSSAGVLSSDSPLLLPLGQERLDLE
ncbi:MAG: DUF1028 domain-containing protein [Acidimicrobiales bacterium]